MPQPINQSSFASLIVGRTFAAAFSTFPSPLRAAWGLAIAALLMFALKY